MSNRDKQRVIIIGANFAGLTAASQLPRHLDVTLIDQRADFQWTPNIHEILSGVKDQRSVELSIAKMAKHLRRPFIQDQVTGIDTEQQHVRLKSGASLSYDGLLIACGQVRSNWGVKGAARYASGFRHGEEVVKLREKIEIAIDSHDRIVTVNIVGGGFTGVEVLGELLRGFSDEDKLNINVIESAPRLVSSLPEVVADDIVRLCKEHRVHFYFDTQISAINKATIALADGSTLPSDITIWSAGTSCPEFIEDSGIVTQAQGIPVNCYLQSEQFPNIFVAGDIASTAGPLPKQASLALDMGPVAAANMAKWLSGRTMRQFNAPNKPVALAFGDLNTYLIQGNTVIASPLLAAAKEAIYQLYMARFSKLLPLDMAVVGAGNRLLSSASQLLLPEILKFDPKGVISGSRVLQWR